MSNVKESIHLLVLDESPDEAELITNALRNAGLATHATTVADEHSLKERLSEQHWSLFLTRSCVNNYTVSAAISLVKQYQETLPIIVLAEEHNSKDIIDGLRMGACDVIPAHELARLTLVIQRELKNLAERKECEAAIAEFKELEKRCNLLLDSSRAAITYVVDGMHVYANQSYIDLFGYEDSEELAGMPMIDMLAASDQEKWKSFLKSYDPVDHEEELSCMGVRSDGYQIPIKMSFSSANYDGEPCIQIVIRSEENSIELQEKLKAVRSSDPLTHLYNRQYFIEQISHAVERANNNDEISVLHYINLDYFDNIKSEVSLEGADIVLCDIARIIKENTKNNQVLARFGEDVFTVLSPISDPQEACNYGEELCKIIENNLCDVGDRTVQTTASIGIAMINNSVQSAEQLINAAHFASNKVRQEESDGNGIQLHTQEDESEDENNDKQAKTQLQRAIDTGMFKILFQPIISLRGDSAEFYEVLLRMLDDFGNEISPHTFLETAAENNVAIKIDRWVIIQTVKVLAARQKEGIKTQVIINLTAQTILDPNFIAWLKVALKAAKIPSHALTFQISNGDAVNHLKQAKAITEGLDDINCNVCVSRFGTTDKPFNLLKHIACHYIKFDGSFVSSIANEPTQIKIKELISGAQDMDMRTIMPLVESASALSSLWQLGFHFIQGYYLQPPMEAMNYDFSHSDN